MSKKKACLTAAGAAMVLYLYGCQSEPPPQGPMEKAGEKIDDAAGKVGEKMEEAGEKMQEKAHGD